jgi:hypothetical protein
MYTRPHWSVPNETIPMLLIGQNRAGSGVVRDSEGYSRGVFPFPAWALRFARRGCAPGGCALMFATEALELDLGATAAAVATPAAR